MTEEALVRIPKLFQKREYGAYAGMFCALVAFLVSYLLFYSTPLFIGVSTILFTTILAVPLLSVLLVRYEKVTVPASWSGVLHAYQPLITYLTYFFVGLFVAFFILALFAPQLVFSKEDLLGAPKVWQRQQVSFSGLPPPPVQTRLLSEIVSIFWHNALVMLVSFALSVFFGAGALFLIALNASVFAAALAKVVYSTIPLGSTFFSAYLFIACNLSVMLLHTIPEAVGYLLAAIGGGILGQAVMAEKFRSPEFSFVRRAVVLVLAASVVVLFGAAAIEMGVSKQLFQTRVCLWNQWLVLLTAGSMLVFVVLLEWYRRKQGQRGERKY